MKKRHLFVLMKGEKRIKIFFYLWLNIFECNHFLLICRYRLQVEDERVSEWVSERVCEREREREKRQKRGKQKGVIKWEATEWQIKKVQWKSCFNRLINWVWVKDGKRRKRKKSTKNNEFVFKCLTKKRGSQQFKVDFSLSRLEKVDPIILSFAIISR